MFKLFGCLSIQKIVSGYIDPYIVEQWLKDHITHSNEQLLSSLSAYQNYLMATAYFALICLESYG